MVRTLKDQIEFRQWLKTVKVPTLSLTEIAKRWAVLENNEGAAGSYLKEIARYLTSQGVFNRFSMSRYLSSDKLVPTENKRISETKRDLWSSLYEQMNLLSTIEAQGRFEDGEKIRFSESSFIILMDEYPTNIPAGLFPPRPRPPGKKDEGDNNTIPVTKKSEQSLGGVSGERSDAIGVKTRFRQPSRSSGRRIYDADNCLPHLPRKRVDDSCLFIREAVRVFFAEKKRCPNQMEIWSLVWERPPNKVRSCERSEPRSEPVVGRARGRRG